MYNDKQTFRAVRSISVVALPQSEAVGFFRSMQEGVLDHVVEIPNVEQHEVFSVIVVAFQVAALCKEGAVIHGDPFEQLEDLAGQGALHRGHRSEVVGFCKDPAEFPNAKFRVVVELPVVVFKIPAFF